jgi:hypothetical protein
MPNAIWPKMFCSASWAPFVSISQRHQISGQCAASGISRTADFVGENVVAGLQVVDRPHPVPDAVLRHVGTEQNAADTHQRVFDGAEKPDARMRHRQPVRDGRKRLVIVFEVQRLIPFTLSDGVITQSRHAVFRQQDGHPLISAGRFAVVAVTARNEHCGERSFTRRQIEIGRDMMLGPAFEQDFLDAIAVPLQFADDLRVERRPFGESSQLLNEKLASLSLPVFAILFAVERVVGFQSLIKSLMELPHQRQFQLFSGLIGEDTQVFRGGDGGKRGQEPPPEQANRQAFHVSCPISESKHIKELSCDD